LTADAPNETDLLGRQSQARKKVPEIVHEIVRIVGLNIIYPDKDIFDIGVHAIELITPGKAGGEG
jgi:hypothetical protein